MSMKERMTSGQLYHINDELMAGLLRARKLLRLYNASREGDWEYRTSILQQLLGSMGEDVFFEPNFRCDYGSQIHIGDHFYANFDCVILDGCPVTIGDHVMFGPQVGIYTASHPIDATTRATFLEFASPVTIGNHVWVGGHTVINGGVEIGEQSVIGSGSVVTKSIPAGVIAVGNPCRVLREITQEDASIWEERRLRFERELASQ